MEISWNMPNWQKVMEFFQSYPQILPNLCVFADIKKICLVSESPYFPTTKCCNAKFEQRDSYGKLRNAHRKLKSWIFMCKAVGILFQAL